MRYPAPMKKPTSQLPKKLVMTRETVRMLASSEFVHVAGGFDSGDTKCVQALLATAVTCPPVTR